MDFLGYQGVGICVDQPARAIMESQCCPFVFWSVGWWSMSLIVYSRLHTLYKGYGNVFNCVI